MEAEKQRAQANLDNNQEAYEFQEAYQKLMQEAQERVSQISILHEDLGQGREDLAQLDAEWQAKVKVWKEQLEELYEQVQEQTEELVEARKVCQASEAERDQAVLEKEAAFEECVEFVKERNAATRRATDEKIQAAKAECSEALQRAQEEHDEALEQALQQVEAEHEEALEQTVGDHTETLKAKEAAVEKYATMMQERNAAARHAARQAILAAEAERDRVLAEKKAAVEAYEQKVQEREAAARLAADEARQAVEERDRVLQEKKLALEAMEEKLRDGTATAQAERDRVVWEKQVELEEIAQERDEARCRLEEAQSKLDRLINASQQAVQVKKNLSKSRGKLLDILASDDSAELVSDDDSSVEANTGFEKGRLHPLSEEEEAAVDDARDVGEEIEA